jgi:hypothetical protein
MSIQWSESKYGITRLPVLQHEDVIVEWTTDGFKVSFAGLVIRHRFSSVDDAKKAGEFLAIRVLSEALEKLKNES